MKAYISKAQKTVSILFVGVLALLLLASSGAIGGLSARVVLSGSMEPTIPTGSVVFTKPNSTYAEGDVITFSTQGNEIPTTHRIVGVEQASDGALEYTTRGDANESEDFTAVAGNAVLGKEVFHIPYLGFVLDFAKKPLGFLTIIGIPCLLILFEEFGVIMAEIKKRRRAAVPVENYSEQE